MSQGPFYGAESMQQLMELDEMDGNEEVLPTDASTLLLIDKVFKHNRNRRSMKWRNNRINWAEHIRREMHTGTFESKYHMPLQQFNKLVQLLRPNITVDFVKSMNSTKGNLPIYPELIVGMGLRYLGGSLVKDLEDVFGVDDSSVPRCVDMFFDAILNEPRLSINLPQTRQEFEELSRGFESISGSDGLFKGCIGAVDGWLCGTIQPIDKSIANKRDYYSGHYQCFGLNVQAICDHRLRFIYFSVAAPGKTGDARAIKKCVGLQQWIRERLTPMGYFFVGDNAYLLCDQLLIPFSGNNITEAQRTYNFYLSQLRIRIEMAFGLLSTKWRIFRQKLENGTRRNAIICSVAAILHNYVINEVGTPNENAEDFIVAHPDGLQGSALGYLPVIGDDEDGAGNLIIQSSGTFPLWFSSRQKRTISKLLKNQ